MNITQEKLKEIADEVKLLEVVNDCASVKLNDKYGVFFEVVDILGDKEIFIELNEIDEIGVGGWLPCAPYNEFAPFGDIQRLIEIVRNYVEAFNEEEL